MQDISLDWYQGHPYVKAWRSQTTNSYLPTLNHLNSNLDIDPNRPITLAKVDSVITPYLEALVSHIREVRRDNYISTSREALKNRFNLSRVEVNYVITRLTPTST